MRHRPPKTTVSSITFKARPHRHHHQLLVHRASASLRGPPPAPAPPPRPSLAHPIRTMATQPSVSPASAGPSLSTDLAPLLRPAGGRWALTATGTGLERSFRFKTFKKTWEFMNAVAAQCAVRRHHPEWSNVYNTAYIRWTTHSPPGLSAKDVEMARYCDEQAVLFGELVDGAEQEGEGAGVGKDLVDRVAVEGGDCCVPKAKK